MSNNMFRCIIPTIAISLVLTACGGPPVPEIDREVSALADTATIATFAVDDGLTFDRYRQLLNSSHLELWGGLVDPAVANDFRDSLILDTLAGYSAQKIDLEKHYSSYRIYQQLYFDFLIRRFWEEQVYLTISVDSADVLAYFDENEELFAVKEQMDLYHILISDRVFRAGSDSAYYRSLAPARLREEINDHVENIYRLLNYGEAFENVAYLFSHDVDAREQAGHVGWTVRGTYIDPFDSIAFSLPAGQYSEPYVDKDGWHIIYSGGYLAAGAVPIDSPQVYESARQTLLTSRSNRIIESIVDSLMNSLELKINPTILDTNIYFVDDFVWVALINGADTIDSRFVKKYEERFRHKYDVDNTTADIKREMIREAATGIRIVQLARARGIDTLPDVEQERWRIWHHRTKIIESRKAFDPIWEPTPEQVQQYYDTHRDEFIVKKPLTLEMLFVTDSAFAVYLREQALTGLDFEQLAADQSKITGLDIEYDSIGTVGDKDIAAPIFRAGMNTQAGGLSQPFVLNNGYAIVHVLERRDSKTLIFAKGGIKVVLKKQHQRKVWETHRDEVFNTYNVRFPNNLPKMTLKRRGERLPTPIP